MSINEHNIHYAGLSTITYIQTIKRTTFFTHRTLLLFHG
jgi:hypothetical protein